jgi:hypothetical protein
MSTTTPTGSETTREYLTELLISYRDGIKDRGQHDLKHPVQGIVIEEPSIPNIAIQDSIDLMAGDLLDLPVGCPLEGGRGTKPRPQGMSRIQFRQQPDGGTALLHDNRHGVRAERLLGELTVLIDRPEERRFLYHHLFARDNYYNSLPLGCFDSKE